MAKASNMNNLIFPAIVVLFILFGIYELYKQRILYRWLCVQEVKKVQNEAVNTVQATVSPAPDSMAVANPNLQAGVTENGAGNVVQGFRTYR